MHTRSFFFPAVGIAAVLAIAFFKGYGALTRPSVPTPVSSAIVAFVPGVSIGKSVRDIKGIPSPYWIQNIGYVSDSPRQGIAQVRLLASPEDREKFAGDPKREVDAVEIIGRRGWFEPRQMGFLVAQFGTSQRDGCMIPANPGLPRRDVAYWVSKKDRGGMAVFTDFDVVDTVAQRKAEEEERARRMREWELAHAGAGDIPEFKRPPPKFALASILFWRGKFDGANTLRGHFVPKLCRDIEEPPVPPKELGGVIAANEEMMVQLGYRPGETAARQ